MAVTIKDIARAAGVSHTTVSRALRGNPLIAADTIIRIQAIAEDLGYVPNTAARGLKTKRSDILGVIVRRIVDPFFAEVLSGIESVLYGDGYGLFLASSNRDAEREKAVIRTMSEHRVDGIIICSTIANEEHRAQLKDFDVPSVMVNNQAMAEVDHSVSNDDVYGAREIMQHLIGLGHRRIAYISNAAAKRSASDRLQGYREGLAAADIEFNPSYVVKGTNGRPETGSRGVERLLALPEPPTAIVCYNDMVAVGALHQLQAVGKSIPADCSVVGFDNVEIAAYATPPLTTFDQPKYELGRQAAAMLLKLIALKDNKQGALDNPILKLRGELVVRRSSGPYRAAED